MPEDLSEVIENSLSDSTIAEPVEASEPSEVAEPTPEAEVSPEVTTAPPTEPVDEFDKEHGLTSTSPTGRENRIPYSRVRKIADKASTTIAEAALGRKLVAGEKAEEVVKAHVAQLPELQSKVKDYEERLTRVGTFENILVNEPQKFFEWLGTLPTYKSFFKEYGEFQQWKTTGAGAATPTAPVTDDMPTPDQDLADGTKVYSLDGLRKLNAWNREQARKETMTEVEKVYGPLQQEWAAQQRYQQLVPVVQGQISEARKWPQFNENEADIVKALQADQKLSLEGAYRMVVFPKLAADRNKVREEVLAEIKKAPRATTVVTTQTKSAPTSSNESRSIEDVIRDQVKALPGRE